MKRTRDNPTRLFPISMSIHPFAMLGFNNGYAAHSHHR
jgi:hypothetical protein